MAQGKIFLCYRREDSAGHAGRLYDRLNQRFPGRVFMDVAGIRAGTRWAEVIEQTLGSCEVAVILIGRRWLERGQGGSRRIDDPDDRLRAEITMALGHGLKIIPVLVAGAAVPEHGDLPPDVAPIADWQVVRIDDDEFDDDATRLIRAIERQLVDEGVDPHIQAAGARQAEIRRLLETAESSIARADWVTAAQTLQAVLSLDRAHAEAAARLRFVQEQSARAFRGEPPPKASAGRWAALGAVGAVGLIGAVVLVLLVAWLMLSNGDDSGGGFTPDDMGSFDETVDTDQADESIDGAEPLEDEFSPPPPPPPEETMAGDYVMTSYRQQGMVVPMTGTLRLMPIDGGHFQFEIVLSNQAGSAWYRGLFQGQGADWAMTTLQTNDSTAVVGRPIPTQVEFDGSMLLMQNAYGQSAAWQRR